MTQIQRLRILMKPFVIPFGCFTKTAVFFGLVMNFSGSTSTNVQLVLLSMFILVSALNAGRYGVMVSYYHLLRKNYLLIKQERLKM